MIFGTGKLSDDTEKDISKIVTPELPRTIKRSLKAIERVNKVTSLIDMDRFDLIKKQFSIMDNLGYPSIADTVRNTFLHQQSIYDSLRIDTSAITKLAESFSRPSGFDLGIQSLVQQRSALLEAVSGVSAYSDMIKNTFQSITDHQSTFDRLARGITVPLATHRAFQALSDQQITLANLAREQFAYRSGINEALSGFANSSRILFEQPETLLELVERYQEQDFQGIEFEGDEDEFIDSVEGFEDIDEPKSFIQLFVSLPPWVQFILLYFLLDILTPQINNILYNQAIAPVIAEYFEDNDKSDREKCNFIKNIPKSLDDCDSTGLRFITGNNVRLREEPTIKSDILDELFVGKVVTIISKEKNWIEVMYDKDGETFSGWVFTRYTARFR